MTQWLQNTFQWIQAGGSIAFPGLGIDINPPMGFTVGSLSIRFYGVIIALGLFLAVAYALKRRKQFGFSEDDLLDGILWIVPVAVICARAYYCIFSWDEFAADPISVFYIWKGGLAIYGGVIGATLGVIIHSRIKKVRLPALLDLVALGFLIGQCVGRWGNFFNREAFGAYCDSFLAMRIPATALHLGNAASQQMLDAVALLQEKAAEGGYAGFYQVHPTFLYESLWNLVGFIGLHFLSKKRRYDGQIALSYVAWYGLGRTFIEGLRMDSLYIGTLRVSQLLAAVTCFIAVALLLWQAFRHHDRKNLFVNTRPPIQEKEKKQRKKKGAALPEAESTPAEAEATAADAPAEDADDQITPTTEQ